MAERVTRSLKTKKYEPKVAEVVDDFLVLHEAYQVFCFSEKKPL